MSNPMRVVFVIKSMEVQGGGAEHVLADVANGLAQRGHTVGLVTFDRPDAPSFYALDDGVKRVGLAIGRPGEPVPRTKLISGLWRMRRAITALHPSVVVGFMHSTYVPLAGAMLGSRLPMVASEHVGLQHFSDRPMQRFMVRATDRCFMAKTVPTENQRQEYPSVVRRKVHALPNTLNLAEFSEGSNVLPVDPPILLCVGRFMEEKDHACLLDAFALLAEEFPQWRLRLAGDGVLRSQLEAQVDRLGLADRVQMLGVINDIAAEYRQAAIVVVPSRYESFGLTVVEALASSRPVVGFNDCLGPLQIAIDGANALLVDGTDDRAASLSNGLRTMMADAGLRKHLGDAGPTSVQRFDRVTVVGEWEQFLQHCVASA